MTERPPPRQLREFFDEIAGAWTEQAVPFSAHEAERPGGVMRLTHGRRRSRVDGHEARFMELSGPKVNVQTLFVLPGSRHLLPLVAAETVAIGGGMKIMVVDFPVLPANTRVPPAMTDVLTRATARAQRSNSPDVPAWFIDARSGFDIFLRTPGQEAMLAYWECLVSVARWWRSEAEDPVPHADAAGHGAECDRYLEHHREHSPGVPLMSRCFGAPTTQAFMRSFFKQTTPTG